MAGVDIEEIDCLLDRRAKLAAYEDGMLNSMLKESLLMAVLSLLIAALLVSAFANVHLLSYQTVVH